jgi:hypothetical protein
MAYVDEVLSEPNLVNYWKMDGSTSPIQDQTVNDDDLAITNATLDVPGALLPGEDDGAVSFDGSGDFGQATLTTLAGTGVITGEFWLLHDSNAADQIALEFTDNYNSNAGGFLILLNSSGDGGAHSIGYGTNTVPIRVRGTIPQASAPAGQWNHWLIVMTSGSPGSVTAYINGQAVTVTMIETGSGQNFSSNDVLNLMMRQPNVLPTAGDMDELALYTGSVSAARALAHYNAGIGAGQSVSIDQVVRASEVLDVTPTSEGQVPIDQVIGARIVQDVEPTPLYVIGPAISERQVMDVVPKGLVPISQVKRGSTILSVNPPGVGVEVADYVYPLELSIGAVSGTMIIDSVDDTIVVDDVGNTLELE